MPAQEFYDARTTEDPTFELAYWWWGLEIAQRWRERAAQDRRPEWSQVQDRLARPRIDDGRYDVIATATYPRRDDHPSLLAALGMLPPTPLIDPKVMRETLDDVIENWEWDTAWGWDFPVVAITAARLGDPQTAADSLTRSVQESDHSCRTQPADRFPAPDLSAHQRCAAGSDRAPGNRRQRRHAAVSRDLERPR